MKLSEVTKGSVVTIANRKWEVLADVEGGVLCLSHDIVCDKAFDKDDNNNWQESSLRAWLNTDFLKEITNAGEVKPVDFCSDLMTEDGLSDYGMCTDKVFLLSADQYRKYRRFISKANDWWWLITADSTYNNYARYVRTDGSLYFNFAYHGFNGVRPACVFSSSISIGKDSDFFMESISEEE